MPSKYHILIGAGLALTILIGIKAYAVLESRKAVQAEVTKAENVTLKAEVKATNKDIATRKAQNAIQNTDYSPTVFDSLYEAGAF